jgi:hypothetical protein
MMDRKTSGDVIVLAGVGTVRMDPIGFAIYADQFLKAGQTITNDGRFSPVPYYLFCRALELILKAFLLTQNCQLKRLKADYGHNLQLLWKAATRAGLAKVVVPLPDMTSDLAQANSYYAGKAFEYFDFRRWARKYDALPPLDRLEATTVTLIESLKPYCVRGA